MREALSRSFNIPAVKTFQEIGLSTGVTFAEKLGIPFTEDDHYRANLVLGGMEQGATPLEIARAFASLGDRGSYKEETTIRRIDDSHGKTVYQSRISKEQVFSEETAFIINDILQSAAKAKGITQAYNGTAYRLDGLKLAAKTGTVQLPSLPEFDGVKGNNDAWVATYNPEYTAVVWMGFDRTSKENHLPSDASGAKYTTLIAKELFEHIYDGKELPDFQKPVGVSEVKLDKKALEEQKRVLLASALTPDEYVVTEYFKRGAEPTEQSDYWVVPSAPYNFSVTLNEDENPVVSFVPRESFVVYNIMRITGEIGQASLVNQIKSETLEPVHWTDTQVSPGETYGYYVIPVHPELKLGGEAVQGPQTEIIYIDIPARPLPGENIWDSIWDWLNPGNRQDDDNEDNDNSGNNDDMNEESPEGPEGDSQDDSAEDTTPPAA
jgi:membrane peptidoglycan carboxypeptidase